MGFLSTNTFFLQRDSKSKIIYSGKNYWTFFLFLKKRKHSKYKHKVNSYTQPQLSKQPHRPDIVSHC